MKRLSYVLRILLVCYGLAVALDIYLCWQLVNKPGELRAAMTETAVEVSRAMANDTVVGVSSGRQNEATCSQEGTAYVTGESVNPNHWEKLPSEVFVGNFTAAGFDRLPYKTKRRGKEAIKSLDQEPSDYYPANIGDRYYPVFASREEYNKLYRFRPWASEIGRQWKVTDMSVKYDYFFGIIPVLAIKNVRFAWNINQGDDRFAEFDLSHPAWKLIKNLKVGDSVWLDITPEGDVAPIPYE